jgi:hypothetical protein
MHSAVVDAGVAPICRAFQRVCWRPFVTLEKGGKHTGIFANQMNSPLKLAHRSGGEQRNPT